MTEKEEKLSMKNRKILCFSAMLCAGLMFTNGCVFAGNNRHKRRLTQSQKYQKMVKFNKRHDQEYIMSFISSDKKREEIIERLISRINYKTSGTTTDTSVLEDIQKFIRLYNSSNDRIKKIYLFEFNWINSIEII